MAPSFQFEQRARRPATLLTVLAVLTALWAAWVWLEAATGLVLLFAAFTLPAIVDLIRNPLAGLTLTAEALTWYSGRRTGSVSLTELDHVRLDTRLDFSVRATAVLDTGRKIRLPFEATPPHRQFEAALEAQGVTVKRFHFQLRQ